MSTAKNFGAVLILIGIALPILSLIFVSNYNPDAGLIHNIKETEIVLRDRNAQFEDSIFGMGRYKYKEKSAIPYWYVLAFGVALVLTGVGVTAFSGD
jgi:hypothetical protein